MSLRYVFSTRRVIVPLALAASAVFFNYALNGAAKSAPSPPAPAFAPAAEYVKTYASDCVTPQTIFSPGETVCAEAGAILGSLTLRYRRFQWAAPNGFVANHTNIKVTPQTDKFIIPTSGSFLQYGTWIVSTVDESAGLRAAAKFTVRNPRLPLADLTLAKAWPNFVYPGETISFKIQIHNPGPDIAEGVELVDEVPTNMVFVALKQESGEPVDCSTPARGETGRSICKTPRLSTDQAIGLVAYYQVNPAAKEGTACTGATQVSSATADQNKEDNVIKTESTVSQPDSGN
ncbi:MAG TPA: hypothetical protein VJ866_14475 [Pyrinomonadaceae bacterium]|nr:hypothetical protein [Pyrinomonadaceae bacterium]